MSPDIEWHVGEDTEQETLVKTPQRKPPRWRKPLVLIAATLGIGLGAIYIAIPEPPSKPITPAAVTTAPVTAVATAEPLATIAPPVAQQPVTHSALENAITREARALADGDPAEYITLQDPSLYQRRQDALGLYSVWGRPADDQAYFAIRQTGLISAEIAWAEVVQYRDGQFFRDVRFFRLIGDRWERTRTVHDAAFWGAPQVLVGDYFTVDYRARDAEAVRAAIAYLAQRYAQICRTFDCADQPNPRTLDIVFQPSALDGSASSDPAGRYLTVTLPTPGAMGLYYSTLDATTLGRNTRLDEFFDRYLLLPALFEATGGGDRWLTNKDGMAYVYAIGQWELKRQGRLSAAEFPYRPELLAGSAQSLSRDQTWTITQADDRTRAQSTALIQFIDDTYGSEAVIKFFKALPAARSLSQALEIAGLPYGGLEARWTSWLKQQRNG